MATLQAEKLLTADEFMALPIEHGEFIDGKVVETMPAVWHHGKVAGRIYIALQLFADIHELGEVAFEPSSQLKKSPSVVRAPDVAFLSNEDLEGKNEFKYIDGAPTLAVEIISQNDLYGEVEEKTETFLEAGTKMVWIVNPRRKTVTVRTSDDQARTYKVGQSVPGGDILPGFELAVADIFRGATKR